MRFKGQVFRAHNPRWSFAPLSGDGAARHGGRFNPLGTPALYTSLRMETAWLEAQQGFPFKPQPLTICAYQVDCEPVLDLTDAAILREHRITPETLACAWEDMADRDVTPPSWTLAHTLIAQGIAAIIVPSFAPGATRADRNVVFWRWSDALPSSLRLIDDEGRIPKGPASWA
ncbi:RES family NAD+ phosphorylase [Acidomonas methanolica]|uniref:RES family NAD+ phosphorylase n=1 Tax=Acidomonas methanolica TaxID=437 RepID=UPI00211AA098|nr:RES domain-containing protein [Acidomonas methanolica]MCQ9156842.1 RES domain-containing protein [Acidomonas methanolica]